MDSSDNQEVENSAIGRGTRRHTAYQRARLEEVFRNCTQHPNAKLRDQLGAELGLDPEQVVCERSSNDSLLLENEKIKSENNQLRETLKNLRCLSCGGPTLVEKDHDTCMQMLKMENAILHEKHEKFSKLLASANNGTNPSLPNQNVENPTLNSTLPPSTHHDPSHGSLPNQNFEVPNSLEINNPIDQPPTLPSSPHDHHPTQGSLLNQNTEIPAPDQQIPTITPTIDQNIPPLSPGDEDLLNFTLDEDLPPLDIDFSSLEGIWDDYDQPKHMDTVTTEVMEKDSMMEIAISAMEELTRILHINEPLWCRSIWDNKFILQRAAYENTFHRFRRLEGPRAHTESSKDSGIVRMGGTQLVEMFLDADKWVDLFPTIITKAQTIQVFESGLPGSRNGALQLMNAEMHILSPLVPSREFIFLRYCKQIEEGVWVISDVSFDSSKYEAILSRAWKFPSGCMIHQNTDGSCRVMISSAKQMRNVMQLANRMIKVYHKILNMSGNMNNNDKVRVSVRKNTELGLPKGMIVSAVTSFSLPVCPQNVLNLLKDINKRPQWDVLCNDSPALEIQRISTGIYSNNCTTIIQPSIPKEKAVLILEESYIDPLESMLVYAPLDIQLLNFALMGEDSSSFPLLPSGFTIMRDDRSNAVTRQSGGSLVTLGYQLLVCSTIENLNMENVVASVNKLVISTVEKFKNLL
ncbi:START domain [Sesbania bispinosa]|nr:START domain [Sesbania bispinosa]